MLIEILVIGFFALLVLGLVIREARANRHNPDFATDPDNSAPGWGGAGSAD